MGEHIPAALEANFIRALVSHASRGIVLSWAVPRQGGTNHKNERTNAYVLFRMREKGWVVDIANSTALRQSATFAWFHRTIMVFRPCESIMDADACRRDPTQKETETTLRDLYLGSQYYTARAAATAPAVSSSELRS